MYRSIGERNAAVGRCQRVGMTICGAGGVEKEGKLCWKNFSRGIEDVGAFKWRYYIAISWSLEAAGHRGGGGGKRSRWFLKWCLKKMNNFTVFKCRYMHFHCYQSNLEDNKLFGEVFRENFSDKWRVQTPWNVDICNWRVIRDVKLTENHAKWPFERIFQKNGRLWALQMSVYATLLLLLLLLLE